MRIVDPQGTTLAELGFEMRSTTAPDRKGSWATGTDPSGVLQTEGYYDLTPNAAQTVNFALAPLSGQIAANVQLAVQFARHLEAPNTLQFAGPVGRFRDMI
jgi:hypothetical protein